MTFEEYKNKFEVFYKIDSPEKLAICEGQYKMHLLHIEAQSHFEPFEYGSENDILWKYEQNLRALLPFDDIHENQLSFLIKPSFDPEGLLIIDKLHDKYILTYTILLTNYWYVFYADNSVVDVEKSTLTIELGRGIGDKLFALIDAAILEARKPIGGGFVLDGVIFVLSRILDGRQIIVFKHSPMEGSKTAKIIDILLYLIDNMNNLNDLALLRLEEQIDACSLFPNPDA